MKILSFGLATMTSVTRGQLIPGLDQMPSFIAAPILSNVKSTLESAGAPELSDEALITILSSEQTLDPTSWDDEFLETVLGDSDEAQQQIAYIQMGQALAESAAAAAAEEGIDGPGDLTSAATSNMIKAVISSDPAIEEQLKAVLGDDLDAAIDDITTGLDNIDLSGDPASWDATFFENTLNTLIDNSPKLQEAGLGDLDTASIATQMGDAVSQASDAGLLTGDLSSSIAGLTDPLQACTGTITGLTALLPQTPIRYITGFIDFDGLGFTKNLATLAKNGMECAQGALKFTGQDTSSYDAVFEYVPYGFLAIEKYIQVSRGIETVKSEYTTMIQRTEDLFTVLDQYQDESYLKYAEYSLNSVANILLYQAEDLIYSSFQLYDDLLLDVPFIEDYRFSKDLVDDVIVNLEFYMELAASEIRSLNRLGGIWIEQMIRESMGENLNRNGRPTQSPQITTQTTQAPANWFQEILGDITGLFNG